MAENLLLALPHNLAPFYSRAAPLQGFVFPADSNPLRMGRSIYRSMIKALVLSILGWIFFLFVKLAHIFVRPRVVILQFSHFKPKKLIAESPLICFTSLVI